MKMKTMKTKIVNRFLMVFILGLALLAAAGCSIDTPEIHGIVLDSETKEPVPDAWVVSFIEVEANRIAGSSSSALDVAPPHLRTGKDGRFVIPAKKFNKTSGLGAELVRFAISASTSDNREGGFSYYQKGDKYYEKGVGDVDKLMRNRIIELTIYIKPFEGLEKEYFNNLLWLNIYCTTGRMGMTVPATEGGCDAWELDYMIARHERYLEKYKNPKLIEDPSYGVSKFDSIVHYRATLKKLAKLYRKKGDYKKALNVFKRIEVFEIKYELDRSIEKYKKEIRELEELLK